MSYNIEFSMAMLKESLRKIGEVIEDKDEPERTIHVEKENNLATINIDNKKVSITFNYKIPKSIIQQFFDLIGMELNEYYWYELDPHISELLLKYLFEKIIEKFSVVVEILNDDWDVVGVREISIYVSIEEKPTKIAEIIKNLFEKAEEISKDLSEKSILDIIPPKEIQKVASKLTLDRVSFLIPTEIKKIGGSYGIVIPMEGLKTMVEDLSEKVPVKMWMEPEKRTITIKIEKPKAYPKIS